MATRSGVRLRSTRLVLAWTDTRSEVPGVCFLQARRYTYWKEKGETESQLECTRRRHSLAIDHIR